MPFQTVQVDEEVFRVVQRSAEPLVDDFNSALRRKLGLSVKLVPRTPAYSRPTLPVAVPEYPRSVPEALRQILAVVHLVRAGHHDRPYATRAVASSLGVFPQTVLDKYTRQLALTTAQFDAMLAEPGAERLREFLRRKFIGHGTLIDSTFEGGRKD